MCVCGGGGGGGVVAGEVLAHVVHIAADISFARKSFLLLLLLLLLLCCCDCNHMLQPLWSNKNKYYKHYCCN